MYFLLVKISRFNIELADIGEPYKLRIGHDNRGIGSRWHLESVTLIDQQQKKAFDFPCNAWFSKGREEQLVRELPVGHIKSLTTKGKVKRHASTLSLDIVEYSIAVFTGDVSGAGTDAGKPSFQTCCNVP